MTTNLALQREYPHSLEAERGVLAGVICESADFEDVAYLDPDDFYDLKHVELWRVLKAMRDKADIIDPATVAMALQNAGKLEAIGGAVYLAELAEMVSSGASAPWYAGIVADKSSRRKLINACLAVLAECYSPVTETHALREKLRAVADGEDASASGALYIADVACRVLDNIANGTALKPLPLPWNCLNVVLKGGIVPGELAVLAARPGMGKTAIAGCIGVETARRGISTLFVSREVKDEALVSRWLAREARVDYRVFRQGIDHGERLLPRIQGVSSALSALPLHILERSSRPVTPAEIRRVARKVKAGLVIVDYLQLITPDRRDKMREREVADMSRAFKELALDLSIPVLLLAQLNRQVEAGGGKEPREPRLSDLRESGAIEQDADIVIFLHSSGREQSLLNAPVSVIVAKGRSSGTGKARLKFEKAFQNFTDDMSGTDTVAGYTAEEDNGL